MGNDVNMELGRLRRQASYPHRPPGCLPIAMVVLWLFITASYIEAPDADGDHRGREEWFGLRAHVPSRDIVLMAGGCVLGTNVMTGLAVVWIGHKRLRLHKLALFSWFVATALIGYPMAQEALALKRISAQAK